MNSRSPATFGVEAVGPRVVTTGKMACIGASLDQDMYPAEKLPNLVKSHDLGSHSIRTIVAMYMYAE